MSKSITIDAAQQSKRATWFKIIEDYQTSGQSQVGYCRQNNINKDHFAYYLSVWRKRQEDKVTDGKESVSFVPMQVVDATPQGRWVLNIAKDITLEMPHGISMQQLVHLIQSMRSAYAN